MTRPLRVDVEGGWYHITARGNNRQKIYRSDAERKHFLELLEEMADRFEVEVHGYVLMDNHYHLLVRTPCANASRAIQWLNISYSIWWNKRRQGSGHVFQGRFKSVLIEEGGWVLETSLYIHFNPVAIEGLGMGKTGKKTERYVAPEPDTLRRRLEVLRQSRWSSYRAYAGYEKAPPWLTMQEVLGRVKGGREGYRKLAERRLGEEVSERLWTRLKWGVVLGEERFAEGVREQLTLHRESPQKRPLKRRFNWEEIVKCVESAKNESWDAFSRRRGDWGRGLAYYLAQGKAGMTLREIGAAAGGQDYVTVAMAIKRFKERMQRESALKRIVKKMLC